MHDRRPMLATPSTGAGNRAPIDINTLAGTHAFDLKMDGIRAFAEWDGANLTLTNRNGEVITHRYPELAAAAPLYFDLPIWLDGEIVADNGRFETTLTRDKQNSAAAIRLHSERNPVSFHAFDLPMYHEQAWTWRRDELERTATEWPGPGPFKITPVSYTPDFLAKTREVGLEGVIAKRLTVGYQFGARSKSWVKFKNLHRVTCLVAGYSPGEGSRAHFGKLHLALVNEAGEVIPCGSCGTGFTAKETWVLKELLDRGETLVVEIEALNRTSGGTLRFPVYKGVRTDVDVTACTADQLQTLPAC